MDFVNDQLFDGRKICVPTIVVWPWPCTVRQRRAGMGEATGAENVGRKAKSGK